MNMLTTHLNSPSTGHNLPIPHGPLDDHKGVVQTPLNFLDKLLGTSTEK